MANVKISNLPIETVLANMTGIAGYNASGTAQISGATIDSAFAKSTSDLQFIVDNGNAIDSNAGTGSIIFKNGGSNTNTTVSVNSISSDTSFSIIGTTNNTNLTFTSGGEVRFTPNASLGTPSQGDVLAAKNALGDVEWVTPGGSTPTLSAVMGQGASYSGSNSVNIQPTSQIIISAGGTNQQLTLGSSGAKNLIGSGQINVGGLSSELLFLGAKDFHFNNYQGSLAPNGNRMRFTAGGNIDIKTGNPGTSTAGGNIIVEPKGGSLTLRTVDGSAGGTSYPGGNVTIGSSSGIVAITSEIELQAVVKATNLPTSDPGVSGQLWNDGGTLKISP